MNSKLTRSELEEMKKGLEEMNLHTFVQKYVITEKSKEVCTLKKRKQNADSHLIINWIPEIIPFVVQIPIN